MTSQFASTVSLGLRLCGNGDQTNHTAFSYSGYNTLLTGHPEKDALINRTLLPSPKSMFAYILPQQ